MSRKLKGIRRMGGRWQMFVRVKPGTGGFRSKMVPAPPSAKAMREWQEEQIEKFGTRKNAEGGLAAKVAEYVQLKASRTTIKRMTADLGLWCHELGQDRPPLSVTKTEIGIVLQAWLRTKANGTVRNRRTALRSFYSTMYPDDVSPVKGTENPKNPKTESRDMGFAAVEAALAAMATYSWTTGVRRRSQAKIRARVIAYTGIPPGLLATILPHDLSLVAGTVRVKSREKGEGVEARTLILNDEAVDAFKEFHAENCYGPFATINTPFKKGAKRAGLDPKSVHLYDLRHTFLTQHYRVTKDRSSVERVGLHAENSPCSLRYTKGANAEVDAAAAVAFSAALAHQRQLLLKAAPGSASRPDAAKPRTAARATLRAVQGSAGKLRPKVAAVRKAM